MSTSYKNKVVIITGSRQGIGKELARQYALKNAKVVLNGRNKEKLQETQEEFQKEGFTSIAIAGDVSNWAIAEELMGQTIECFGRIDIVITNAGISTRGNVEDLSPEVYKKLCDINILGSVYPAKAAIPYLKATKGSMLFISSISSFYGIPYNAIYCATKNAVSTIAEASHIELKPFGVFAGVCYVGFTENETTKEILDTDGSVVLQAQRTNFKKQDRTSVAKKIIRQIERKQFKKTLSPTGKLLKIISKYIPSLLRWIYSSNLKTIEENSR